MLSQNMIERFNELPGNLSAHLRLTVIALFIGVAFSVPAAVWLVRHPRFRYPALASSSVIQTIPGLALLALMVPLLDKTAGLGLGLSPFGFWPAIIALTLYSILPILRNTVTGIEGVDRSLIQAARGVGMTEWQTLFMVQLPLAAPVIIAGIRTAAVWMVSVATLATPVGQRCLGNYIFTGLQTRNWTMVMFGVVSAAALAIVLDLLIAGVQRGYEERRRTLGLTAGVLLFILGAGGLFAPNIVAWARAAPFAPEAPAERQEAVEAIPREELIVRIGSKTFTEQYILASLIERTLRDAGFRTNRSDSLGSIVIFDALRTSEIDVYVEYTGTVWANSMRREDAPSPWRVEAAMSGWLAETHGIRTLGTLGFENAYALAMRRSHAEELTALSIDDITPHAGELRIAGDYEFFVRPEWEAIRSAYGLRFGDRLDMDSTLMYEAIARGDVDIISAFSSDGRIAAYDLVTLDDPAQVIPPYDAVVLLSPRVAERRDLAVTLQPLIGAIDVELMRRANHMVDRDDDPLTVDQAALWLHEQIAKRAK